MMFRRSATIPIARRGTLIFAAVLIGVCISAAHATSRNLSAERPESDYQGMSREQLKRCAEEGDVECMLRVARGYRLDAAPESDGREQSREQALRWYLRAKAQGSETAAFEAGAFMVWAEGSASEAVRQRKEGLAMLRSLAASGNVRALEWMGKLYGGEVPDLLDLLMVEPDEREALRWYLAIPKEKMSPGVKNEIGLLYLRRNKGIRSNLAGIRWLLQAHEDGYSGPELAELLISGRIAQSDLPLAAFLIESWIAKEKETIEFESRQLDRESARLSSAERAYVQKLLGETSDLEDLANAHRIRFRTAAPVGLAAQRVRELREIARLALAKNYREDLIEEYRTIWRGLTKEQRDHVGKLRDANSGSGKRILAIPGSPALTSEEAERTAFDVVEPIKPNQVCRDFYGIPLAVLSDERDPYSWHCVGANRLTRLIPPRWCEVRRGVKVAALLDAAGPLSWVCVPQSAIVPPNAATVMRPALPPSVSSTGPTEDQQSRAYFESNFVRNKPHIFLEDLVGREDKDIALVKQVVQSGSRVETRDSGSFYRNNFGRNIVMLIAHNAQSLHVLGLDRSLRILNSQLRNSDSAFAAATDVHLLLREFNVGDEAKLAPLLAAGIKAWVADEKVISGLNYALTRRSLSYDLNVVVIDRHGFVRASADGSAALSLKNLPATAGGSDAERWLRHAFVPYAAPRPPASVSLDALMQATSLRGLMLQSPDESPAEIRLSSVQTAALGGLLKRQASMGTEISASLFSTNDRTVSIIENQSSVNSRYQVSGGTPEEKLAGWLTAEVACVGSQCRRARDWGRRYLGEVHTHPLPYSFSYEDNLAQIGNQNHEVLVRSDGVVELLVPTVKSLSTGRKFGLGGDEHYRRGKHWLASFFLIPGLTEHGLRSPFDQMASMALRAQAMGYAYYAGSVGDGRLSRVGLPQLKPAAIDRPVLELFDEKGGIEKPIDRLRLALLARASTGRHPSKLLDDMHPEDAFSPYLSTATRALLHADHGRALSPNAAEVLFQQQIQRKQVDYRSAPEAFRFFSHVNPPWLSFYSDQKIWRDTFKPPSISSGAAPDIWVFCALAVTKDGTGKRCLESERVVVLGVRLDREDQDRYGGKCNIFLRLVQPANADGSRETELFCPDGRSYRWLLDRSGDRLPGSVVERRWMQ